MRVTGGGADWTGPAYFGLGRLSFASGGVNLPARASATAVATARATLRVSSWIAKS